jgi:putative flippase GtrA
MIPEDKMLAQPAPTQPSKVAKYLVVGMMALAVAEAGLVAYLWSRVGK